MAAPRKSGKNSHPNAVKNSLLARKPPRRRAPLRANTPLSSSNRASLPKQEENESRHSVPSHATGKGNKRLRKPFMSRQKSTQTSSSAKGASEIPVMPAAEIMPSWLSRIHQLQKISSIITFALVSATLAVYALNVYSQQSWGTAYKRLQNLQKIEQQLTTKNEVLKNKIAGEAEKASTGLVSPNPKKAIFISPASSPANQSEKPSTESNRVNQTNVNQKPMGY